MGPTADFRASPSSKSDDCSQGTGVPSALGMGIAQAGVTQPGSRLDRTMGRFPFDLLLE